MKTLARTLVAALAIILLSGSIAVAQQAPSSWGQRSATTTQPQIYAPQSGHAPASAASAMRPLGSSSIVDRYRGRGVPPNRVASIAPNNPVRQTAYQIGSDQTPLGQPQLPSGGFQVPSPQGGFVVPAPQSGYPNPAGQIAPLNNYPNPVAGQVASPQTFVGPPSPIATGVTPSPSHAAPIASVGTSPCVSPPSSWTAGGAWDSGQYAQTSAVAPQPQPYAPSQTYAPAIQTPDQTPGTYAYSNGGYRPIVSAGTPYPGVQLGRGIVGQPTAYVPGQPIRNFFRYIFP